MTSKLVAELAKPLEEEVPESTPAQKNFRTKAPKMTDYNKKRATETTEPESGSSETARPIDRKVLRALNQVVQDPVVQITDLQATVGNTTKEPAVKPITIELTGTGN